MANVFDVASYILEQKGPMSAMKLQKLVYYSQAWSLVWDDEPLFQEEFQAWANGPVSPSLYNQHRGCYTVDTTIFSEFRSEDALTFEQIETINIVLDAYANKSAQWLSDQTHSERPWIDARDGLEDKQRGSIPITLESMAEYYGSLQ